MSAGRRAVQAQRAEPPGAPRRELSGQTRRRVISPSRSLAAVPQEAMCWGSDRSLWGPPRNVHHLSHLCGRPRPLARLRRRVPGCAWSLPKMRLCCFCPGPGSRVSCTPPGLQRSFHSHCQTHPGRRDRARGDNGHRLMPTSRELCQTRLQTRRPHGSGVVNTREGQAAVSVLGAGTARLRRGHAAAGKGTPSVVLCPSGARSNPLLFWDTLRSSCLRLDSEAPGTGLCRLRRPS